ncbi:phosphate transporter PHO1 homolog 10 isoform X1 [Lactuca sativa]|uniref:phosphate transporter PHO1 homolog 10 isoform X1 n=2 Tax=Lactuca sativa TaxID=4236 RepID=UPI000CA7008B|nr:phosphate transporter PHO1 homolog 10 isoform X1 [Lactuca sativa]XP_023731281.1 phosphate transporter PHO1 homolog 10 isoform X1 [Lactuca sativa]XP_023731282.1 phosphate transporter PHO1 homolog 10 isoform X1 [Lactuca sativa]XP_023731283.1 phosphate transporter PHO1 homolog 10 isoform X1 [Lactuca sativa]XP_023731284.1 phosphate transporter PHO1 homolog 10 isoform X1 [Lactuca sativa]
MKFGKEFKQQKVPEWIEAYMDYNGLKRILHEIKQSKLQEEPQTPSRISQQRLSLYRPFSGLNVRSSSDDESTDDVEDQVIAVETVRQDDTREVYNTNFLMSPRQSEVTFFEKLDEELNKVNTFYRDKVEEVIEEATSINKQMNALIALRIKVEQPDINKCHIQRIISTDSGSIESSNINSPSRVSLDEEQQSEMNDWNQMRSSCVTNPSENRHIDSKSDKHKSDLLDVLDRVKINNTLESPMSTIRSVLNDSKDKDLRFKKEELKEAEGRMKVVFIEFYRKLHLLKHYSYVNILAFSKIMKKYEKIAIRRAARSYMKIVDDSYIGSCDEVTLLLDRVEGTFIKYFANSNRREGMKLLRPKRKKEKHRVTFFSGFFSGCSIALLIAAILLIQARKVMSKQEHTMYMENVFPLYSLYAYIILHMLLYAANIYFWKRCRINYPFIFGFKQGTELSYQDVFLVSTGVTVVTLSTFLLHVHMKLDSVHSIYEKYVELIPLILLILLLLIFFCPFNILYKSSRFFLIKSLFHCICAPLYKVSLADFFLADQLTSQIQAMRCLEFYICYYGMRWYQKEQKCHTMDLYNVFYIIVAIIPYWIRFLQCVRRLVEEKDWVHLINGSRYLLTIIAVVFRTVFELKMKKTWKVLALMTSIASIMFNTYWDIVVDWGLLQRKSNNLFLRDKLSVRHTSVYFVVMVLDVMLRLTWLQLILKFNLHYLKGTAISSLFSCLEIFRRGVWMFFRLENEHLNNVGKYRAFKSVPLPFSYYEEEDEEDDKDD